MIENSDYRLAISFTDDISKELLVLVQTKIQEKGFKVRKIFIEKKQVFLLQLHQSTQFLKEAEYLKIELQKPVSKIEKLQKSGMNTSSSKYIFESVISNLDSELQEAERYTKFKYNKKHKFLKGHQTPIGKENDHFYVDLFTSADQIKILISLLYKIQVSEQEKTKHNLKKMQDNYLIKNMYFTEGLINDIVPLHDQTKIPKDMDLKSIRNYYGDNVAQYFDFVQYLQEWLKNAAFMGCMVMIINYLTNEDVDHSPWDSIYSFAMILWANLFCACWTRHEKKLQILWRCGDKQIDRNFLPQCKDSDIQYYIDPVTGKQKSKYKSYKRYIRYLESFLVTMPIVIFSCGVLMLSLNFRGYADPNHIIYIESVSQYSQPGRMFDKNTSMSVVSSIIHVLTMLVINIYYSEISYKLTQREMHSTKQDFNSSLVAKRFFFETFNTFTDLAYLGFVQCDIVLLKQELLSYFMTDEARRLICESLIPFIKKNSIKISMKNEELERSNSVEDRKLINRIKVEMQLEKYELFDDYLEIVINFGYITLFASAFPVAPLFTILFHWMEYQSDRWKIKNVFQRPLPTKQSGIGSWLQVLNIMSILSILTNIFLFAFASHKIAEFFPSLFVDEHNHLDQNIEISSFQLSAGPEIKKGKSSTVIAVIFIIENLMFLLIIILRSLVSNYKKLDWVNTYQCRQYKKIKLAKMKEQKQDKGSDSEQDDQKLDESIDINENDD